MNKKLSCFLCWLPLLSLILLVLFAGAVGIGIVDAPAGTLQAATVGLLLLGGYLLLVGSNLGVLIWLIIRTVKNPNRDSGNKVIWVTCLLLFRILAYPVYWFVDIRRES